MMTNDYSVNKQAEYFELLHALDVLYANLNKYYRKFGIVSGDWMLYNLVYDKKTKKIL